jgi:hypothetical protein
VRPVPKVLAVAGFKLGIVVDRRPDCLRKRTVVEDANAVVFALSPAARNGIFECRDGAPKFVAKCANADRDKNLRIEWPEIPAETAYLQSNTKFAVRGDWMVVEAVRYEPVS